MVERFHADPRIKATELLLQERVPAARAGDAAAAGRSHAHRARRSPSTRCAASARRRRAFPHATFLSNGHYVAIVTNAGGGASFCRGRAVTRDRRDATRDPASHCIYLRDVRSGSVWSPTGATDSAGARGLRRDAGARAGDVPSSLDDGIATNLEIAVSHRGRRRGAAAGDHEPQRSARARSKSPATPRSCSSTPAADLAHPAFGKLFIETAFRRGMRRRCSAGGGRAASTPRRSGPFTCSASRGGRRARSNTRPIAAASWAAGAARTIPQALDGRSLSNTVGATLDPIVSLRQRVRLAPGGFVRLSFATGIASSQETAIALARKYCEPSASARTFALAATHAQSTLRHLGISTDDALAYERLASRVLYLDGSLRAERRRAGAEHARQGSAVGAQHLRRLPDSARPRRARRTRCR